MILQGTFRSNFPTHNNDYTVLNLFSVEKAHNLISAFQRYHHTPIDFPKDFIRVLSEWGYDVNIKLIDLNQLLQETSPFIFHLNDDDCYSLMLQLDDHTIKMIHPVHGEKNISFTDLKNQWRGLVIRAQKKVIDLQQIIERQKIKYENAKSSYLKSFVIKDKFLSEELCQRLIEYANPKLIRSTVSKGDAPSFESAGRTSYSMTFKNFEHEIIGAVIHKIRSLPEARDLEIESVQITRFRKGEFFNHHYDSIRFKNGLIRVRTIQIFLNDNFEGGEVYFPKSNVNIYPKKGRLFSFGLRHKLGRQDRFSWHEEKIVVNGTKYIADIYLRAKYN